MLKYLAILAVVFGMTIFVATQDQHAANRSAQKPATVGNAAPVAESDKQHPQSNVDNANGNGPGWYSFFRWPNGTTTWAIILTLIAIAEQTYHTRRAAEATQSSVSASDRAYTLAESTAKKQLRAYFGAAEGKLYIRDDGSVESRVTLTNCGQTPAYDLQVIESGRFETRPFKKIPRPDHGMLQPHTHIVGGGQPYYFTGRPVIYGKGKESLLNDLSSTRYAFILNCWCTYTDIFKEAHHVDFQLIIGGGTAIQKTIDQTGEWLGLFTDSEGNSSD